MMRKFILLFFLIEWLSDSYAQYTATDDHTAEELADELTGDGLVMLNPVLSCGDSVNGIYSGTGGLGFNSGIVLSTGNIDKVFQPYDWGYVPMDNGTSSFGVDEDMNNYLHSLGDSSSVELFAACVLEVDVIPKASTLTLDYIYATGNVGEIKIQSESSPIFSGITTSETQEKALFRFLLTGTDYSGIIASQKKEIRKASANAKIDLLNQLIQQSKTQLLIDSTLDELDLQLSTLDRAINLEIENITQNENEIDILTFQRKSFWESAIQAESKVDQLSELKNRFELLSRYYDSDLERLSAIIEAGDALVEIKVDSCPTCGSDPKSHRPDCVISEEQLSSVVEACLFEKQKISSLKSDLISALSQVQQDIDENTTKKNANSIEYKRLDEEIYSKLNPTIQLSKERIAGLYSQKQRIEFSIKSRSEIDSLKVLLDKAESELKAKPKKEKAEIGLLVNESGPFIETVYATLKSWGYPELDTVYFSEIYQDFVIGEKSRSDQGKGYRALSHAAFIVALMEYCLSNGSNHPGFVVLDSPLVTFRGTDPDVTAEDGISIDVKDSFFIALNKTSSDRQIIIIDNDEPPAQVKQEANYIHFTKDKKSGRFGFIPI